VRPERFLLNAEETVFRQSLYETTPPRKYPELPGTSVTVFARYPPVHDSAAERVSPFRAGVSPGLLPESSFPADEGSRKHPLDFDETRLERLAV